MKKMMIKVIIPKMKQFFRMVFRATNNMQIRSKLLLLPLLARTMTMTRARILLLL